ALLSVTHFSERDVVVEAVVIGRRLGRSLLRSRTRRGRSLLLRLALRAGRTLGVLTAAFGIAAAAAEQLHGAAHVHHDLGGVAVLALLVLPLAGLQAAFDVALRALAQVLAGDFGNLAKQHD